MSTVLTMLDEFQGIPWNDHLAQIYESETVFESHRKRKAITENCLVLYYAETLHVPMDAIMDEILGYASDEYCVAATTTLQVVVRYSNIKHIQEVPVGDHFTGLRIKYLAFKSTPEAFQKGTNIQFDDLRDAQLICCLKTDEVTQYEIHDDETLQECRCLNLQNHERYRMTLILPLSLADSLAMKTEMKITLITRRTGHMLWNTNTNATITDMERFIEDFEPNRAQILKFIFSGEMLQIVSTDMRLVDYGIVDGSTVQAVRSAPSSSNTAIPRMTYNTYANYYEHDMFPRFARTNESLSHVVRAEDVFGCVAFKMSGGQMIEFERPVVNPVLLSSNSSFLFEASSWDVTILVKCEHDGSERVVQYICSPGSVTRHTLLYDILKTISDNTHITETPLMLRLLHNGETIVDDAQFVRRQIKMRVFSVDVLPYQISPSECPLISHVPLHHRVLGMVCVVKVRSVFVLGRVVRNKPSSKRALKSPPPIVGVLVDAHGTCFMNLYKLEIDNIVYSLTGTMDE
eukprot:PhF_6_TR651/c0_g1_i4/m.936